MTQELWLVVVAAGSSIVSITVTKLFDYLTEKARTNNQNDLEIQRWKRQIETEYKSELFNQLTVSYRRFVEGLSSIEMAKSQKVVASQSYVVDVITGLSELIVLYRILLEPDAEKDDDFTAISEIYGSLLLSPHSSPSYILQSITIHHSRIISKSRYSGGTN